MDDFDVVVELGKSILAHQLDLREITFEALRLDARPRGQGDPCQ